MTIDTGPGSAWVPQSCTLPTVQQPLRVAEFDTLFTTALRAVDRTGPTRLRLVLDAAAEATVRDLAERKTACCSFLTFAITPADDNRELYVDITIPDTHVEVLDALADRAATTMSDGSRR